MKITEQLGPIKVSGDFTCDILFSIYQYLSSLVEGCRLNSNRLKILELTLSKKQKLNEVISEKMLNIAEQNLHKNQNIDKKEKIRFLFDLIIYIVYFIYNKLFIFSLFIYYYFIYIYKYLK